MSTRLEQNTTDLQSILAAVNALPDAGSGGTDEFFEQYMERSFTTFESDMDKPILYGMFRGCNKLVSVSCPNVPSIENGETFRYCKLLKTVDFPNVEEIGERAFMECSVLDTINFPKLKRLKGNTFNLCKALTVFPYFGQLEEIGGYEFRQCPIEQKVWDFENLTKISAQHPFNESVAEVVIFRKAVSQMDRIFYGMPNLRVVDLHKSFRIGRYAFQNSNKMEALILRDAESIFVAVNQDVLTSNTNYYVYVPAALLDTYKAASNWSVAPERIRAIEDYPEITGGVYDG